MPMAQAQAEIHAVLTQLYDAAEKDKITKRLPPESGLEAIGVRMKQVFDTAKEWQDIDLSEMPELLTSRWYEMRMVGVSVLDFKARSQRLSDEYRRQLYETYIDHHAFINVWDLVDRAAPRVVGWYLLDKSRQPLFELARSEHAIERRTSITAAFWIIRKGDLEDPLALAELLLEDPSELVTKPVGTALREVGKIDQQRLLSFLTTHSPRMSRPTLRLATYLLPDQIQERY